ncbi:MAG TPA: hypothetical protein VMH33_05830 [Solirubrobacterales bacterium]|nr:hypothetical protein [Solirubrobacterales bacterium]
MRPGNETIAAPDLPTGLTWIGAEPESMPALTAGGPAIVHFFDFAQLNSVKTLPYLAEWERRYRGDGLRVIGVQAPRFPFGADPDIVAAGLADLGVGFPVAIDGGRTLWQAYGCEGWPSLFLWSLGGALAWFHFGEGEYLGTEMAIQEELREIDALRPLPEPVPPLRPADAPDARVVAPSVELFPGGAWDRPWVAGEEADELVVEYEAGGAWATIEGTGELRVTVDGEARPVEIPRTGIYELATHERHGAHSVALRPEPGMRVWSVSFDPGLPAQ